MEERRVEGVLRVVAKKESSFEDFGRRESGMRVMRFGAESRAAVQGMRRKGSLESEGAILILRLWKGVLEEGSVDFLSIWDGDVLLGIAVREGFWVCRFLKNNWWEDSKKSLRFRKQARRVTVEIKPKSIRSRLRPRDALSSCSYVVVVKASAGPGP